jgi:pyruvate,water dikinase
LISGILNKLDFDVKEIEDIIDAAITKYKKSHLEEKLEVLGKLTVYTKQMDAIMRDDTAISSYMEQFVHEHIK